MILFKEHWGRLFFVTLNNGKKNPPKMVKRVLFKQKCRGAPTQPNINDRFVYSITLKNIHINNLNFFC